MPRRRWTRRPGRPRSARGSTARPRPFADSLLQGRLARRGRVQLRGELREDRARTTDQSAPSLTYSPCCRSASQPGASSLNDVEQAEQPSVGGHHRAGDVRHLAIELRELEGLPRLAEVVGAQRHLEWRQGGAVTTADGREHSRPGRGHRTPQQWLDVERLRAPGCSAIAGPAQGELARGVIGAQVDPTGDVGTRPLGRCSLEPLGRRGCSIDDLRRTGGSILC